MTNYNMKRYKLSFKPFGPSALLIEWPEQIDELMIQDVIAFEKVISWEANIADTIIAYNSLTVVFRETYKFEAVVSRFERLYTTKNQGSKQNAVCWQIPVCYDVEFGLDLEELASSKQLSVKALIELHTAPKYLIYFMGFQPGFPYLGGLPEVLHTPRKANPRLRVDKGSVGIGGQQTGIYPQDSSGGWNILGRSPVNFFDVSKLQPCFTKAGDYIQFEAIDKQTFLQIDKQVQKGTYEPKSVKL